MRRGKYGLGRGGSSAWESVGLKIRMSGVQIPPSAPVDGQNRTPEGPIERLKYCHRSDRIVHGRQAVLTCPTCCFDSMREVTDGEWQCEVCGTSYSFPRLRKALNTLVGQQFSEDFICELLLEAKPERYPKLGERCWKWSGLYGTLLTIDMGNCWHLVIKARHRHA